VAAQLRATRVRFALLFLICVLTAAAAAAEPTPKAGSGAAGAAGQIDGLLGGFALGGDRGPVRIDADTMEFDYKTKVLTYRGSVTVTQADMTLRSNTLRVSLDEQHLEKPKEVVAEGKVQIDKGARRATGGKAVFDNAARTVTLSDQARLQDGPNEVAGERVVLYLDEERSVVEGGPDRVRAVLYPSNKEGSPLGKEPSGAPAADAP
jgi:lipopolysaccharide export system protein LptA